MLISSMRNGTCDFLGTFLPVLRGAGFCMGSVILEENV